MILPLPMRAKPRNHLQDEQSLDRDLGLIDVHILPELPPTTYTEKTPAQPGFYWLQDDGHSTIVNIQRTKPITTPLVIWYSGESEYIDHVDGQWCGPLQPPKEN